MPSLQIRDMPPDLYEALAERARRARRSLAQQAVADLSQIPENEARQARLATIDRLRRAGTILPKRPLDPSKVIRDDRRR